MKKVKLNYRPVAKRRSNEVAYEVSSDHVKAVNHAIGKKTQRNAIERQESEKAAKDFRCK